MHNVQKQAPSPMEICSNTLLQFQVLSHCISLYQCFLEFSHSMFRFLQAFSNWLTFFYSIWKNQYDWNVRINGSFHDPTCKLAILRNVFSRSFFNSCTRIIQFCAPEIPFVQNSAINKTTCHSDVTISRFRNFE